MRMRLSAVLAFIFIIYCPVSYSQTTINLSTQDTPDNQTWNNGTWSVQLVNAGNPGQSSIFTVLTGGGSVANQSGSLSGTGTASMSLPANVNIGPGGSKWQFTVCPQASAGCFISNVIIGTSSPQTVALTPPSIRINLTTATPPVSLYATGEVTQAVLGSQFFLITTSQQQFCTAVTGTTCTTWGGGGNSTPTPGSQISFGKTVSPLAYGAKWDVKFTYAMVATSGSQLVTCPDCNFTAADQGKLAQGFASPFDSNHGTSLYAAVFAPGKICNNGFLTSTTVNMCASDGVTAENAANSCTPSNAASTICTFAWGTADDTTAINNAATAAWSTGGSCGALELPAGGAFFSSQILAISTTSLSLACGGQTSAGNIISGVDTNQTGPEVYGQGPNNTILIPYNFNFTSCSGPESRSDCVGGTDNMEAHDFAIAGLGANFGTASLAGKVLFELQGSNSGGACTGSTGFNLSFSNWAVNTGANGLQMGFNACGDPVYSNIVSELFGTTNCIVIGSGVTTTLSGVTCFGYTTDALIVHTAVNNSTGSTGTAGVVNSYGGFYGQPLASSTSAVIVTSDSTPGIFNSIGDSFYNAQRVSFSNSNTIVAQFATTAPATINLTGDSILMGSNCTGTCSLFNAVDKGLFHVKNSILNLAGASNRLWTGGSNNAVFFDDGGNTFKQGGTESAFQAGGMVSSTGFKAICNGVATASSTLALNISGLSLTGTGLTTNCTGATLDKGVAAQGAKTIQNLVCSSSATTVSVACTVMLSHNGGAFAATAVTCTMTAATICSDTIHNAAAADGDLVSIEIVTGAAETGANIHAVVGLN